MESRERDHCVARQAVTAAVDLRRLYDEPPASYTIPGNILELLLFAVVFPAEKPQPDVRHRDKLRATFDFFEVLKKFEDFYKADLHEIVPQMVFLSHLRNGNRSRTGNQHERLLTSNLMTINNRLLFLLASNFLSCEILILAYHADTPSFVIYDYF